jgi:hypothetical protein
MQFRSPVILAPESAYSCDRLSALKKHTVDSRNGYRALVGRQNRPITPTNDVASAKTIPFGMDILKPPFLISFPFVASPHCNVPSYPLCLVRIANHVRPFCRWLCHECMSNFSHALSLSCTIADSPTALVLGTWRTSLRGMQSTDVDPAAWFSNACYVFTHCVCVHKLDMVLSCVVTFQLFATSRLSRKLKLRIIRSEDGPLEVGTLFTN